MAGYAGRRRHDGTDEVGAASRALPTFKIAVGGGRAALAGVQPVLIHGQAHGTSRLAPFKTGSGENPVQSLRLSLALDQGLNPVPPAPV